MRPSALHGASRRIRWNDHGFRHCLLFRGRVRRSPRLKPNPPHPGGHAREQCGSYCDSDAVFHNDVFCQAKAGTRRKPPLKSNFRMMPSMCSPASKAKVSLAEAKFLTPPDETLSDLPHERLRSREFRVDSPAAVILSAPGSAESAELYPRKNS